MVKKFVFLVFLVFQYLFSSEYLVSPYIDKNFELPWPKQSFFIQSWRSYLETIPGIKFLDGIGMGFCHGRCDDPDSELRILSESGFKNIRIEIGWSCVSWDEDKLNNEEAIVNVFKSCKKYGIKPLILLNAHHGVPCPNKSFKRKVISGGAKGSREIILNDVSDLVPHYSGISNLTGYIMNEVFITKIDPQTKKVELSKPLPKEIKDGEEIVVSTMKYLPAHPVGTKEFEEMAEGWLKYVKLVCETAKKAGLEDKDFELEIWNELSFGSAFMGDHGINNYYDPPKVRFSKNFLWEGGHAWEIAKRTVDYIKENYPRTRVIWGFSNTTFYHTPITQLPPKIDGQSYHPYGTAKQNISEKYPPKERYPLYIEKYIPKTTKCMPEGWAHLAIQCETLIHLLKPESRYKNKPKDVEKFYHYMTEHGWNPFEAGISDEKEALNYKAKCLIRGVLFWINKGIDKIYIYCDLEKDNRGFGILNSNYKEEGFSTPALKALSNIVNKFKDSKEIKNSRQLDVEVVSTGKQYKVFKDLMYIGKEEEKEKTPVPSLYYREMFTFLPFQITDNKFICGVYVMSYDITKQIPPMNFRLKIKNVYGENSNISYYDPLIDKEIPLKLIEKGKNYLNIEIEAVDYPRLIIIEENVKPILINNVKVEDVDKKTANIYVSTSIPAKVSIDCNLYNYSKTISSNSFSKSTKLKIDNLIPGQKYEFRVSAEDKNGIKISRPYISEKPYFFITKSDPNAPPIGLKTEYYISNKPGEFSELKYSEISPSIYLNDVILQDKTNRSNMIAVRYSGEIFIENDDKYTFYTISDDGIRAIIDDKKIIENWTEHGPTEDKGEIELKRGWHKISIEYFEAYGGATLEFYYSGSNFQKVPIPSVFLRPEK